MSLQKNKIPAHILPLIVFSQFCCTSLWFAGNGIMDDLISTFNLPTGSVSYLTSAVQLGFIIGTLLFSILSLVDRFSPSRVFFLSAVFGATANLLMSVDSNSFYSLLTLRFVTGFFLAGIYPVGMKIATDYHKRGLGKALGFLVGALVLGTASPHLFKGLAIGLPWESVLVTTSSLSVLGGTLILFFVPIGPYRKKMKAPDLLAFGKVFRNKTFRSAAIGYFGHMWELYAFWAFIPIILTHYVEINQEIHLNIPITSFLVIGIGSLSCICAGFISVNVGTKKVAAISLFISFILCLASPLLFQLTSSIVFLLWLLMWGAFVISDSPMFSTLVADNSLEEHKGTALTIVNGIGFAITIISIQLLNFLSDKLPLEIIFVLLGIGPLVGLIALYTGYEKQ